MRPVMMPLLMLAVAVHPASAANLAWARARRLSGKNLGSTREQRVSAIRASLFIRDARKLHSAKISYKIRSANTFRLGSSGHNKLN